MCTIPSFIDRSKLIYTGFACSSCPKSECQIKLEYGNMRYHLVLNYNRDFAGSVENKYLQKVYDVYDISSDDDKCEQKADAVFDCTYLFWKFIKQHDDRISQDSRQTCEDANDGEKKIVKMQVKTVDGSLQVFEHDRVYERIVTPIENPFPDLNVFQQTQVHYREDIDFKIYKVMIEGAEYCLKTIYSRNEETFLKELTALRNMPSHPNIISLSGVVATDDERIEGILTPYINGTTLHDVTSASEDEKNKWKQSITDAIEWLHARDLVWGDAKPRNIMIEENTKSPVLVDFGGGSTKGWVDLKLTGSREGDLQGLKRIKEFIDNMK